MGHGLDGEVRADREAAPRAARAVGETPRPHREAEDPPPDLLGVRRQVARVVADVDAPTGRGQPERRRAAEVEASLAATGGVYSVTDVIKSVMAGAACAQMTSVLLQRGPAHVRALHEELTAWMEEHEYDSLRQMHGSMSRLRCPDPDAYDRANYMRTLQSWHPRDT